MTVEELFSKINELSTKVEELLKSENEAECESLLLQRHALLVQLSENVTKLNEITPSKEPSTQYREFLKSIQKRDNLSIEFSQKQIEKIIIQQTKQVKGKKAIKAYKKLSL